MDNKNELVGLKLVKEVLLKFIKLVNEESKDIFIDDIYGKECIITYKNRWSIRLRPYYGYTPKGDVEISNILIKFYYRSNLGYKFENLLEYESIGEICYLRYIKDIAVELFKLAESKTSTRKLLVGDLNTFTYIYNEFVYETKKE